MTERQTDRQDVKITKYVYVDFPVPIVFSGRHVLMTACTSVCTDRHAQAAYSKDKGFVAIFLLKYKF